MIIDTLPVGPIMANCYILGCEETRSAAVIDPGDEVQRILAAVARHHLQVRLILNTHGHFDHVGGNRRLKEATGAEILIHRLDAPMLAELDMAARLFGMRSENSPPPDRYLEHGDRIQVGTLEMAVLHTPGHTPGGVCFHGHGVVFAGDTLFAGSIGRTDFPGGDFATLAASIRDRLFTLPDAAKVLPGHMGPTTIAREKHHNPFVGRGAL
jgi:glyoxylase-like metal-dependent hydrolase (beta-lactamase superfamily II)